MNKNTGDVNKSSHIGFWKFFHFEIRRSPGTVVTILAGLIMVFALISIQTGSNQYKQMLKQTGLFKKSEKQKVDKYVNNRLYGIYGVRIIILPSPISVFFNQSAVMPDITAFIDSGERFENLFIISR